jgi:KUP system potassium uptake protein
VFTEISELGDDMRSEAADVQTRQSVLILGALCVVFGDIGTSPIYAFLESFKAFQNPSYLAGLLGVLSLIFGR